MTPQLRPERFKKEAAALVFSLTFILVDWLSYIHPIGHLNITPWNPPAALEVLFLSWAGMVWIPWVYLTLGVSDWLIRGAAIASPAVFLGNLVLVLCYAGIAKTLRGVLRGQPNLRDRLEVVLLSAVTLMGALVTSFLYVSVQTLIKTLAPSDFWEAIYRFFIGDLLGMMVLLPLVFLLMDKKRHPQYRQMLRSLNFWILMVGLLVCMAFIFSLPIDLQMKYFFPLFFAIGLIAAAHSLPGATLAAALVQLPLVFSATQPGVSPNMLIDMQIVMLTLSLTGLIIGAVVDERMRAQERLRESLQLVAAGELAGSLAHELHQPMSALNAYAESALLLADSEASGKLPDARNQLLQTLRLIANETVRASDIVRGLRSFFISGVSTLQRTSALQIVTECMARLEPKALLSQVSIHMEVTGQRHDVLVDAVQISTALGNLLKNAIEASPAGARVLVRVAGQRQHMVHISVFDQGLPLSPEDVDQVFRPFYSQKKEGLGLGLSVSKSLVENNAGLLRYQEKPEKCFQIILPTRALSDE